MTESDDVIRLYLDDDEEPFKTARPPMRFQFSTLHLVDGPHRLRIEAHNGLAGDSVREIPFQVRNGVAITVSGLDPGQEIAGQVGVIINAYAGNTEVDFEPSRAETPQPIPTWAWLIFLGIIAFIMFYVLNPATTTRPVVAAADADPHAGERVFVDNCAKCHGENGLGLGETWPAPRLKDDEMVLESDPTQLVTFVVAGPVPPSSVGDDPDAPGAGRPRVRMPAWGTRLEARDVFSALNHVRTSWGNQAPVILASAKQPPAAIKALEREYTQALQGFDLAALERCLSLNPVRPVRLVRPDDNVDYSSSFYVLKALRDWLRSVSSVNSLAPEAASYAVIPDEGVVCVYGTMVMSISEKSGGSSRAYRGSFVRVYVLEPHLVDKALKVWTWDPDAGANRKKPNLEWHWVIAFDWARLPMPIGCARPGAEPERSGGLCTEFQAAQTFFPDIQRILRDLGQSAPQAPHSNFWTLPYKDFVGLEFPYRPLPGQPEIPGATIKLINLGQKTPTGEVRAGETNFIKALRDGKDILVKVPGRDDPVSVDIARMPKDAPPMNPNDIARIEAWILRGMPEKHPVEPAVEPGPDGTPPGPGPTPPVDTTPPGPGPTPPASTETIKFADVIALLNKLGPKFSGAPHGNFLKKPYAEFVDFKFDWDSAGGTVQLIDKGHGADSNLIHALKGEKLKVVDAKGNATFVDVGKLMPPSGKGVRMPDEDIEKIRTWIDAGAPEK